MVSDIEAARAVRVDSGVDVSEVFHRGGSGDRLSGPDPARRSYSSFASFSDPDGNGFVRPNAGGASGRGRLGP